MAGSSAVRPGRASRRVIRVVAMGLWWAALRGRRPCGRRPLGRLFLNPRAPLSFGRRPPPGCCGSFPCLRPRVPPAALGSVSLPGARGGIAPPGGAGGARLLPCFALGPACPARFCVPAPPSSHCGAAVGPSAFAAAFFLYQSAPVIRRKDESFPPASGPLPVAALLGILPRRRLGRTAQGCPAATVRPGSVRSQLRY